MVAQEPEAFVCHKYPVIVPLPPVVVVVKVLVPPVQIVPPAAMVVIGSA